MAEERVIPSDPEFEEMARRTLREYEARRRRQGDGPGAAGTPAPIGPPPPVHESSTARPMPERDETAR